MNLRTDNRFAESSAWDPRIKDDRREVAHFRRLAQTQADSEDVLDDRTRQIAAVHVGRRDQSCVQSVISYRIPPT